MNERVYSFERLIVWNDVRKLTKYIYAITANFPESEKFGLVNQTRRSIVSVSSNIAEGSSRTGSKDQAHFYQIAYSSLMELLSQTIVSFDLGFLQEENYNEIRKQIEAISAQLNALRKSTLNRDGQNKQS